MDWKNLIAQIRAAGLTQSEIARRCDCSQTAVCQLVSGKTINPGWLFGQHLIALHEELRQNAVCSARCPMHAFLEPTGQGVVCTDPGR